MKIMTFIFALMLWTIPAYAFFDPFSATKKVIDKDGIITLDTSDLAKGASRHFQYENGKNTFRFFVVRDEQGVIRAALDACEVCWHEGKGYKLDKGMMLCINCGRQFALSRIGAIRGGCNPHPVAFKIDGNTFAVTTDELKAGAKYFPEK